MKKNKKTWKKVLYFIELLLLLNGLVELIVKVIDYIMDALALPTTNHSCVLKSGFTF